MRFFAFCILSCAVLVAQTSAPSSQTVDQATPVVQKAASTQFGANSIQDVQLNGTVTTHFGKDQSGTITMQADSTGKSKVTFNLDSGQRTEYSSGRNQDPACAWTDAKGTHQAAIHNCWTDGAWFFPILTVSNSTVSNTAKWSYIGVDEHGQHLTRTRVQSTVDPNQSQADTTSMQKLGTEQVFFDSTTLLPTLLTFNTHPDNDAKTDIPIEVRFSDYRDVNGVKVPFHIEKSMNGNKLLEITVETATFNTGLPITK